MGIPIRRLGRLTHEQGSWILDLGFVNKFIPHHSISTSNLVKAPVEVPRTILRYSVRVVFGIAIGLITGLAVVALLDFHDLLWKVTLFVEKQFLPLLIALTMLGLILANLIVRIFTSRKVSGCGTHDVIEAYHGKGSISLQDAIGKSIASAITIGFGGGAGMEGPGFLLGGGIGSTVGRKAMRGFIRGEARIFLLSGMTALPLESSLDSIPHNYKWEY